MLYLNMITAERNFSPAGDVFHTRREGREGSGQPTLFTFFFLLAQIKLHTEFEIMKKKEYMK